MSQINFQETELPIPDSIFKLSHEQQLEIYNYLSQMDEIHKKAYIIAMTHLKTSFSILKSNGFNEWKKSKSI